jgi:hypothetical protein
MPHITEHQEQANFITYVTMQYGNRVDFSRPLLFAVPNGAWFGGKNSIAMFKKFEAEGFRRGVADLLYLQPRGPYSFLAIEMKASHRRNEKAALSLEQVEFLTATSGAGGAACVCFGCDEAMKKFDEYMKFSVTKGA